MVSIFQATNATALNHVRALMRAFLAWHRERHGEDHLLIDHSVEPTAFEQELGNLPGPYVLPRARSTWAETEDVHFSGSHAAGIHAPVMFASGMHATGMQATSMQPTSMQPAGGQSAALQAGGIPSFRERPFIAVATCGLLIAYHAGQPIGCVALRNLGDGICELKRMFVTCEFRGLGVGRALAARAIADARQAGYGAMRLNTSRRQTEAIQLYEKAGFTRIPAYGELAETLKPGLIFFERRL